MSQRLTNREFAELCNFYFRKCSADAEGPRTRLMELNLIKHDGSDWVISEIGKHTVEVLIKAVPAIAGKILARSLTPALATNQSVDDYLFWTRTSRSHNED